MTSSWNAGGFELKCVYSLLPIGSQQWIRLHPATMGERSKVRTRQYLPNYLLHYLLCSFIFGKSDPTIGVDPLIGVDPNLGGFGVPRDISGLDPLDPNHDINLPLGELESSVNHTEWGLNYRYRLCHIQRRRVLPLALPICDSRSYFYMKSWDSSRWPRYNACNIKKCT